MARSSGDRRGKVRLRLGAAVEVISVISPRRLMV